MTEIIMLMARKMGVKTIAEGVETDTQLSIIEEMGCDFVQGFYASRPLGIDKLMELLNGFFPK